MTSPEAPRVIDFRTSVVFHQGLGIPASFCVCQRITQSITEGLYKTYKELGVFFYDVSVFSSSHSSL